jgi:hypothetical protein
MFIGFSKTLAKFGGFRLGVGMRVTKKNAAWAACIPLIIWFFQMIWYMIILSFWLMYAVFYGMVWLFGKMFKSSGSFFKKFFKENIKKEGNQA